jgi:hypothetical protein
MRSANRTFRKTFALAAVALLLLVSQPAETRARVAQEQPKPFVISSLGSHFGVQVAVVGTYTVSEKYVDVYVEQLLIRVSEHCPYQGRRFVNTILVGLATTGKRGGWEVENRSLPVFVEHVMGPREEHRLAGLRFQIPRNEGTDLSKRWLVVETEETSLDVPDADPDKTGYAFAHSCRTLFASPCAKTDAAR